jgi:hypothetical protein
MKIPFSRNQNKPYVLVLHQLSVELLQSVFYLLFVIDAWRLGLSSKYSWPGWMAEIRKQQNLNIKRAQP